MSPSTPYLFFLIQILPPAPATNQSDESLLLLHFNLFSICYCIYYVSCWEMYSFLNLNNIKSHKIMVSSIIYFHSKGKNFYIQKYQFVALLAENQIQVKTLCFLKFYLLLIMNLIKYISLALQFINQIIKK